MSAALLMQVLPPPMALMVCTHRCAHAYHGVAAAAWVAGVAPSGLNLADAVASIDSILKICLLSLHGDRNECRPAGAGGRRRHRRAGGGAGARAPGCRCAGPRAGRP